MYLLPSFHGPTERFSTRYRPAGAATPGILSRVCLPLASLPVMNVSTLDTNLVLLKEHALAHGCELLAPHFDVRRGE